MLDLETASYVKNRESGRLVYLNSLISFSGLIEIGESERTEEIMNLRIEHNRQYNKTKKARQQKATIPEMTSTATLENLTTT